MTFGVLLVLAALKAVFIVALFSLNIGGVLTWTDRRQGAMMQDRIGPNRAVFWVPKRVAQGLALGPAVVVAVGVVFFAYLTRDVAGEARTGRAFVFAQLAVFMLWATALIIAGRVNIRGPLSAFDTFIQWLGDPRRIFYAGLAGHGAIVLVALFSPGAAAAEVLGEVGFGGGALVFAAAVLFGAGYAAYNLERTDRLGIRLAGLLHPAADGLKTLFKEDFVPPNADHLLHALAPVISFFPVLVLLAVVPFGDTVCFAPNAAGQLDFTSLLHPLTTVPAGGVCATGAVKLQVLDLNMGLLFVFALAGTGIVGAALAGWSSDNKFSLLGGLRAAGQMVSYEVTLGLTLVGLMMVYGTLRFDEMVVWQMNNTWGVFVQPLACVMFFAAAIAESKRIPFDLPEGESEIVAGYFTEYSGMKFAMFFFSEYVSIVVISGIMATAFFGGWHIPFLDRSGISITAGDEVLFRLALPHLIVVGLGVVAFTFKTVALCLLQLAIRWTLPRFRYDQLMRMCWRILLPASLINILATGLVLLAVDAGGPSLWEGLRVAAAVTQALIVVVGTGALIALVRYWLTPVDRRPMPGTSVVRWVEALGATPSTQMGD